MYSGCSFCMAEAPYAQLIREARVCIAEAYGVRGFPTAQYTILKNRLMVIFKEFKYLLNLTNICSTELQYF